MKTTIGKTTLLLAVVGPTLMALPAFGGVGPCLSGGQIGACPGWVDVNGNGVYDPGEPLIGFSMNGNVLTIVDPWSNACGETSGHMITFGNSTGCGYTTASTTTNPVEGTQMITATR